MMLRTKYSNMDSIGFSEKSGNSSDGRNGSDHLPTKAPRKAHQPIAHDQSFLQTPQDDGRLFMVSGQQPMLHCRNTSCNKTGTV